MKKTTPTKKSKTSPSKKNPLENITQKKTMTREKMLEVIKDKKSGYYKNADLASRYQITERDVEDIVAADPYKLPVIFL
jgi:hypothetical protein